ncbi:MAG: aminotransferase class I/II-fold pyridoxal phosphate-dependent enzyme [Bacillota bacterium]
MPQRRYPVVDSLKRYVRKGLIPFHTPGHLQGKAAPPVLSHWWGRSVFEADLTEVPGLDDLSAPVGAIRRAQEQTAAMAGAGETFFLVNGSTAGVQAMFLAATRPGDAVILPRAVHRSVISSLVLSGAQPEFIPGWSPDGLTIPLPPRESDYREALERHPRVRALFTVYPDYYGVAADLKALSGLARACELPLLVDAAHGVLFGRHPGMPPGAMACGADAAVESVHKRAGALTQAAWLHVQGDRLERSRIRDSLRILTTTSPSYLLLASLDGARRQLEVSGFSICERQIELAEHARRALSRLPGVGVLRGLPEGYMIDPTRLVVSFKEARVSGLTAAKQMRRCGVVVEMADFTGVVLLFSPAHRMRDLKVLLRAVETALKGPKTRMTVPFPQAPPLRINPREAWLAPAKQVALESAVGLVSAETAAPAPPGIPVLVPGEEVTPEAVAYLKSLRDAGVAVHGTADRRLETLRVVR